MIPVLTIGIPTFNRKFELADCLHSIQNAWKPEFEGMAEVVVSSNASHDGTDEFMRDFEIPGLPIHYTSWSENVGPIRNFYKLFETATGRYCWMLSDDDAIEPSAIGKILTFLTNNPDVGGLMLKAAAWDPDLIHPIDMISDNHEESRLLVEALDVWKACLHDWGLLSVCVVSVTGWRDCMGSVPHERAGAYPHVWIQAEIMRRTNAWGMITEPLVRYRTDRDSFLKSHGPAGRALIMINSYGGLAIQYDGMDKDLAAYARNLCCDGVFHYTKELKLGWGGASSTFTDCIKLFGTCGRHKGWKSPKFYYKLIPMLMTPGWLLAAGKKLLICIRKINASIIFVR